MFYLFLSALTFLGWRLLEVHLKSGLKAVWGPRPWNLLYVILLEIFLNKRLKALGNFCQRDVQKSQRVLNIIFRDQSYWFMFDKAKSVKGRKYFQKKPYSETFIVSRKHSQHLYPPEQSNSPKPSSQLHQPLLLFGNKILSLCFIM